MWQVFVLVFVNVDRYVEVRVFFDNVTCVYVWYTYEEKFDGSRWSFSWLFKKVKDSADSVGDSPFSRPACLRSERRGHRCPRH